MNYLKLDFNNSPFTQNNINRPKVFKSLIVFFASKLANSSVVECWLSMQERPDSMLGSSNFFKNFFFCFI